MAKKPRQDRAAEPASPFNNAFADLGRLKAQLKDANPPTPSALPAAKASTEPSAKPTSRIVLQREKKGRGGKTVTRVSGLELPVRSMTTLAKELKRFLGCGAVVEGSDIVLQGNQTERAAVFFERKNVGKIVIGN